MNMVAQLGGSESLMGWGMGGILAEGGLLPFSRLRIFETGSLNLVWFRTPESLS